MKYSHLIGQSINHVNHTKKNKSRKKNEEKIEVGFKPDRPFRAAVCPP